MTQPKKPFSAHLLHWFNAAGHEEYDTANDGPEVEIIRREHRFALEQAWLAVGGNWPAEGEVDSLDHRRE